LKFTNIKVTGFKSFAEPEQISIDEGLTGIVGPNGCGKSNIVESLKWLMGESSAKSMRGGELEDIIFSGTAARPSRNFAEVTLTLDNTGRSAPAALNDGDDIEITRKIERGKGSSFRINGKSARARDVQLLFADMSTGSRSSGIVSQGRVGSLINAKPIERRNLLEEAANIRGLHQRRHEAELRLNTAETNMERLDDILVQLDEQNASLVKQARQAARYRSIADRIRKADAHLMLAQFTAAIGKLDETEAILREAQRLTAEVAEVAAEKTLLRNNQAEKLPPLRQTEAEKAAELQRLTLERDAIDQEEARLKKAAENIAARKEQIKTDTEREQQLLSDAERAITSLDEEKTRIIADNNEDEPKLARASEALEQAREASAAAELALTEASARSRAAKIEEDSVERRIEDLSTRLKHAEEEIASINIDALTAAVDEKAKQREETQAAADEEQSKRSQRDELIEAAQEKSRLAGQDMNEKAERFARIRAEVDALSVLAGPGGDKPGKPISSSIKVKNGLEAALAAALGDGLAAPIGTDSNAYWRDKAPKGDAGIPKGTSPLADALDLPEVLKAAVSGIGIVNTAKEALALQSGLEPGQSITTPKGGLWRWDGYVQPIGAETSAAQRLKQEARLRELEKDMAGLERDAAKARALSEEAEAALTKLREEMRGLITSEREAGAVALAATHDHGRAVDQLEAARRRFDELTESVGTLKAALDQVKGEAEGLTDPEALSKDIDKLKATAEETRAKLAEAMGAERTVSAARKQRDDRMRDIEREREYSAERQKGAHARLEELAGRAKEAEREAEALANSPSDIDQRRQILAEAIDKAEAARRKAADDLAEAETALNLAVTAEREAEQAVAAKREDSIRAESQRELARQEQDSIVARIKERLNTAPEELRELATLKPDEVIECDENTLEALQGRYDRLIRERENVGPVNLRAEAEMEEIEERVAGITTERTDLVEAISKLRVAISQLNREGRERLLKSFADVNRYFETLFKALFDGGSAELKLTDAEDPLEAGLEILASPPGKKLQSLSLLSGGEQALTALALIFAVFLTNPSPVCILDEVDAPLDDTNVARFCDMLAEIAAKTDTRFIIVTHHRLTMARMDRLYGVTMEQKGVSRIVSVDLQTAEKFKEAG
jgi:chromosome segregation protein